MPSRLTLFLLGLLFTACTAAVQAADGDRWFRVELLVFSHNPGTPVGEAWDPTPALAYPGVARFLVEPDRLEANQAEYEADSTVDEFGRQILTFPEEAAIGVPPVASPDITPPGTGSPNNPEAADEIGPVDPPGLPTPFRVLPAGQREFEGKAAYMQRTGRYATLFHQAWLQPVPDRDRALPLVVDRSGDTGEWPELQGSILLYLSRYLHLETNLWLNTPGSYLPGDWQMPAPPLGPPSLIVEEPPAEPEEEGFGERWLPPDPDPASQDDLEPDAEAFPELEQGPVFPYRHAILLSQNRRMRSNEVHYIDHPLMGVVVKLTPLADEDLALLAQAEQGGDYPPLQP